MKVRTVVMAPAAMCVVKGLEKTAAREPPELLHETVRDQFALGAGARWPRPTFNAQRAR